MIVITGGAGFIGSVLAAEIERRALGPVVIADWLGDQDKWKNISKRQIHDLVSPCNLIAALGAYGKDVKAIFHMGAISDTSCRHGDEIVENNLRMTFDLWNWCCINRVPFIYASSASTYGDGTQGFNDDCSSGALAALRPLNLYAWSKHVADRKFAALDAASGPTPPLWAGFKFFNVFGPNEYHKGEMRSVVYKTFERIRSGNSAILFKSDRRDVSDGGQMRDFVWVDDVVDAMIWFYQSSPRSGIYNLGSGHARSFADLAAAVFSSMGLPLAIEYVEMPEALKGGYQYFTRASMDRLRTAGWKTPSTSLEQGVETYVRYYLLANDRYR